MTFLTNEQIADVYRVIDEYHYFRLHKSCYDAPLGLRAFRAMKAHPPVEAIEWQESGRTYCAEFTVFSTSTFISFVPVLTCNGEDCQPRVIHSSIRRMRAAEILYHPSPVG